MLYYLIGFSVCMGIDSLSENQSKSRKYAWQKVFYVSSFKLVVPECHTHLFRK